MKIRGLLFLLAACAIQPGCSFVTYSVQNLVEGPLGAKDRCIMRHRFEALAEEAWQHFQEGDPAHPNAVHYKRGFVDGYVAYLDGAQSVEPPGEPPWIYRSSHFESPEGPEIIREWQAGYRQGASMARASGYREAAVLIPIGRPPYQPYPPITASSNQAATGDKSSPELPTPRKMPPADGEKAAAATPRD
jgi:hypothetical protein